MQASTACDTQRRHRATPTTSKIKMCRQQCHKNAQTWNVSGSLHSLAMNTKDLTPLCAAACHGESPGRVVKIRRNMLPSSRGVALVHVLKPARQDVWKDRSSLGLGTCSPSEAAICTQMMGTSTPEHNRQQTHGGGGRSNRPYADSLPHSSQFQGGGGRGEGGAGSRGVWAWLQGRGAPGPQHIRLKMTPSLR